MTGKTTAIDGLQLRRRANSASAAPPLSDADNDASRFLSSFAAEFNEILPPGLTSPPKRSAEVALWILYRLNSLGGPLNIFFDDLDALRNSIVIGLMSRGLEAVPQDVQTIVGPSSVPEVGFSRLRDKGGLRTFIPAPH